METSALATLPNRPLPQPDLKAIKARQQAAWSSGDYAVVGTTLQIVGEELCEAIDLRAGQTRARCGCRQRQRCARRRAPLVRRDRPPTMCQRCWSAPASAPWPSGWISLSARPTPKRCRSPTGSFDAVVSTFGVMFTPDQERAASELVRVCKRGGKIGLANWTPEGFIGQLFKTIGRHVPPPAGAQSPAAWGTRGRIGDLFGRTRRPSEWRSGISRSATARRSTGWTCSGPTTARC